MIKRWKKLPRQMYSMDQAINHIKCSTNSANIDIVGIDFVLSPSVLTRKHILT